MTRTRRAHRDASYQSRSVPEHAKDNMTDINTAAVLTKIVEILTPLSAEERRRVIAASLTLLGDEPASLKTHGSVVNAQRGEATGELPSRTQLWMNQNSLSMDDLQQVFHIADGTVEVIASEMPGKNDKEKTYSAYILSGIANLVGSGSPAFDDHSARALCKSSGCFTGGNHAGHLSQRGNEFTGSKEKGWILTAPGLKRGAELIKELSKREK